MASTALVPAGQQAPERLTNTHTTGPVFEYVTPDGRIVDYDMNRLVFCDPAEEKVPTEPGKPTMVAFRLNIMDRTPSGQLQPLLIKTEESYCYGLQANTKPETGALDGYGMNVALWNMKGPSIAQKHHSDFLEKKIGPAAKAFMVANGAKFGQPSVDNGDLKYMFFIKRRKLMKGGKAEDPTAPPTLNLKCLVNKTANFKIRTGFYLLGYAAVDPLTSKKVPVPYPDPLLLMGMPVKGRFTYQVESIYINSGGFHPQLKLIEADIIPADNSVKRIGAVDDDAKIYDPSDGENARFADLLKKKDSAGGVPNPLALAAPSEAGLLTDHESGTGDEFIAPSDDNIPNTGTAGTASVSGTSNALAQLSLATAKLQQQRTVHNVQLKPVAQNGRV